MISFRAFAVTSTLALSALSVAACSSTAKGTGNGTSGSSGGGTGRGLLGGIGGGSSGGTTSGGTTSGGASSGGATTCAKDGSENACGSCLKTSCCAQLTTCTNNAGCVAIFNCSDACTTDACLDSCFDQNPGGQSAVRGLASCAQKSCASPCELTEEGASSGGASSSGSSGSDKCLPGEFTDASYCPDPSRPRVKDCPGGAPSTACALSPSQAANVYCCP